MWRRQPVFSLLRRSLHAKSWTLPVDPGGTLKVRLPTTCVVRISPLNPHVSAWDHARVDLSVLGETDDTFVDEETAARVSRALRLSVAADAEPGRAVLMVEAPPESVPTALARTVHMMRAWVGGPFRAHRGIFDSRVIVDVALPGKFDLDVEVDAGGVEVDGAFQGNVKIQSGAADIAVNVLKSMYIDLESESGDVSGAVLQGNLSVRADNGRVNVGRVQGPSVRIVSACGDIEARALYAEYAMLRSRDGAVRLGGAQGYTKVRTVKGDVEVAGVEGRLDVETDSGDVEASLSLPRVVSIRTRRGDVRLGLPEDLKAEVMLEGETLDVQNGVLEREEGEGKMVRGEMGEGDGQGDRGSVHARAPVGDVVVRKQSWQERMRSSPDGTKEEFPRWVSDVAGPGK